MNPGGSDGLISTAGDDTVRTLLTIAFILFHAVSVSSDEPNAEALEERLRAASKLFADPSALEQALKDDPELIRAKDRGGRSLLYFAASFGKLDAVKVLVTSKADLNSSLESGGGDTPLHAAIFGRYQSIVEFLIEAGAEIDATCAAKTGCRAPIEMAVSIANLDAYRILASKGAKTDGFPSKRSLLNLACHGSLGKRTDRVALIKELLKSGEPINAIDGAGRTPLMDAAETGMLEVIDCLLESDGIDLQKLNSERKSALHYAAESYQLKVRYSQKYPQNKSIAASVVEARRVVEKLIAAGLNTQQKDLSGYLPVDYVTDKGAFPNLVRSNKKK